MLLQFKTSSGINCFKRLYILARYKYLKCSISAPKTFTVCLIIALYFCSAVSNNSVELHTTQIFHYLMFTFSDSIIVITFPIIWSLLNSPSFSEIEIVKHIIQPNDGHLIPILWGGFSETNLIPNWALSQQT